MCKQFSIKLDADVKRKLARYIFWEGKKTFSDAVRSLLALRGSNLEPIHPKILARLLAIKIYYKCASDNDAIKLLIVGYIQDGNRIPTFKELFNVIWKDYNSFTII